MKTTAAMDKVIGEAHLLRGRGTAPIHRGRWGIAGNAGTLKGLVSRGLAEIVEDWHVLTDAGEARRVSLLPVVEVTPITSTTQESLSAVRAVMAAQDIVEDLRTNELPGDVERAAQADEDAASYAEILSEQDCDVMPGGAAMPWKSRKGKHGRHARNR